MRASPIQLMAIIGSCLISSSALAVVPAKASDLAVGQTFACAPEGVVAVVGRLDPGGKDGAVIASVSLFDNRAGATTGVLGHIPVDAQILAKSCPKTVSPQALAPDFGGGYAQWRAAFESGTGGYFTIPVSEILDVVKKMMSEAGATQ
jgi:hypothetical protein